MHDHPYVPCKFQEPESGDGSALDVATRRFYIGTNPQTAAVQTSQKTAAQHARSVLDGTATIEEYDSDRHVMERPSDAIRGDNGSIVHGPRFGFDGSAGYDGLPRSGLAPTRYRCAATRPGYDGMLKGAIPYSGCMRRADAPVGSGPHRNPL